MKKIKTILSVILLLITAVAITSCSELRSEFEPHKWRYQSFVDRPPSLESYFGHPGPLNSRGGDVVTSGKRYKGQTHL